MSDRRLALKIAVVDDDPRNLESIKNLLESADHRVLAFGSARAMLDSGCLPEIDCVISDIGMPGMDGFELLQAVHSMRPELQVILVTAHAELLTQVPRSQSGRYRLFQKPFESEALLAAIGKLDGGRAT